MDADSHSINLELQRFLEIIFPKEVKAKRKSNQKQAKLENFGI
jgi:hypothetical protein